jgi:hypothetical protein
VTTIINGSSPSITFSDGSAQTSATRPFLNRIINGAMVIDQRNAGASVTPGAGNTYTLDRWLASTAQASKFTVQQNAAAVTPPAGYKYYLGTTSSSAYSVLTGDWFNVQQRIEGFNVADLNWGTANAKTVTLSFWVRSSLTGTFGGAIKDSTNNYSYPFSYTINSANTWEFETITISGPTAGTWSSTTGIGMQVLFSLGAGATYTGTAGAWAASDFRTATGATSVVGTNGATFYITGVQLEVGSTATSFDYRPYGTELALCQRYYFRNFPGAVNASLNSIGWCNGTTLAELAGSFPVTMRIAPTALEQSGTAGNYKIIAASGTADCSSVPLFATAIGTTANGFGVRFTVASGLTDGRGAHGLTGATTGASGYLGWSAEL